MRILSNNGVECEFWEVRSLLPELLSDYEDGLREIARRWHVYEVSGAEGRVLFDVNSEGKLIVRIYPRDEIVKGAGDVPKCISVLQSLVQTDDFARLIRLAEIAHVVLALK
jgi:hypothetical protein